MKKPSRTCYPRRSLVMSQMSGVSGDDMARHYRGLSSRPRRDHGILLKVSQRRMRKDWYCKMSDAHGQFIKAKRSRRKSGVLLHEQNSPSACQMLRKENGQKGCLSSGGVSWNALLGHRHHRWIGSAEYTHLDNNRRSFLRWVKCRYSAQGTTRPVGDMSAASFSSLRDDDLHHVR